MNHLFRTALLVSAASLSVGAQQVKERLATPAGEVRITQLDAGELGNKFAVTLGDKLILQTNGGESGQFSDSPVPTILKHFDAVTPFDAVIVFQQNMWGNACDGGPLWFLGLKGDGSFSVSSPIDFCGGRQPVVKNQPVVSLSHSRAGLRTEGMVIYLPKRGFTKTVGLDSSNLLRNLANKTVITRSHDHEPIKIVPHMDFEI